MAATIPDALNLPFEEAIAFFRQKLRVPTQRWDDIWQTAHDHAFMVAGAASDDLLADFQKAIQKALDHGTTLEEFRKDFDTIVADHGWEYYGSRDWRSQIIYETNLSTAYSAGRFAQLDDPDIKAHFPFRTYVHGDSRRPRPQHLAWNGLTLRADDPFWDEHTPPNGWRCSCRVSATSDAALGRMGKDAPDKAPPRETAPYRDGSGRIHQVPVGIDPGFGYNPGKAWQEGKLPVAAPDWKPVGGQ